MGWERTSDNVSHGGVLSWNDGCGRQECKRENRGVLMSTNNYGKG